MSGVLKVLTGILGVMAVVACLATVGIIGYSLSGAGGKENKETSQNVGESADSQQPGVPTTAPVEVNPDASAAPDEVKPDASAAPEVKETPRPVSQVEDSENHVHDYEESVEEKATCYKAGRLKYTCECGDSYYVDIMSTGHVPDDWEIVRVPTADREGLRVKKCIYCDDIIAQESVTFESEEEEGSGSGNSNKPDAYHVHQYTSTIEREATCILAGLRKYTCGCGNFYTEMIPADGHVAPDWTVVEEPTTTRMGREQRTCNVCGVVLDSRPVNVLTASPSSSADASTSPGSSATARPSATTRPSTSPGASASAGSSASPSSGPTPHQHSYRSYVLKTANCSEKGIISYVCSCGSSYAENVDKDLNNHTFRSVVIPATKDTQGYTAYTCVRCNFSYFDNYTPAIGK